MWRLDVPWENLRSRISPTKVVGIFDGTSVMTNGLRRFGYCFATTNEESLFGPSGTEVRGHEFHHSIFNTSEKNSFRPQKRKRWRSSFQLDGGLSRKGKLLQVYLQCSFLSKGTTPYELDSFYLGV